MNADPPSDISSVCATEEDGLLSHSPTLSHANRATRYSLLRGSQQFHVVQSDARHKVALPLLYRRCEILRAWSDTPHRYAAERQKLECELKSITQTQGARLLKYIIATFCNLCHEYSGGAVVRANIDYDRQLNTLSVVQEIQALQVKLDAVEDEDDQRALEEDITGKILWLCWCGICAEADELLPKVGQLFRLHRGHVTCFRLWTPFGEKEIWR
ncbi:hypothetical protein PISMIDRAFT_675439 [Pisolithus microcarpus 441]|uniref:Uncharacterized protein n=1 Tax=Pisolithus microcarpus 441 TaxID=765257 RepID=A0A0C9ZX67_9AGAM|nr:hypothetical protein BKA83DRAFT_675439 [Pisolithus microcarpus]KIK26817.1 hypothetical protein PISMIDRAFT_675439 [Pisolithus microcarpus 441]